LDPPDLLFVQASCAVSPVPRDEGNGISLLQKLDNGFYLPRFEVQFFGDVANVNGNRLNHIHPFARKYFTSNCETYSWGKQFREL
jgi:hypothetical protein